MGHTGFRACQGGTGAPESTVESVPRKPGKRARKKHRTPYARDIISAGGALGEVIVIERCVVFCHEESDLRAERQQHVVQHGKNGSQAQHIGTCEQSKGNAKGYIRIRPVGMVFLW